MSTKGDAATPNIPADQELAERVVGLYQKVNETLNDLRVPQDKRKEIEQDMMEAVAADLLVRLGKKLSEKDKNELALLRKKASGEKPDLNAVAGYFQKKFSQEELVKALAESTESVLSEFTDAMK